MIEAALSTIGMTRPENARVVRIKNTLQVGEVEISEILMKNLPQREDLELITDSAPMVFDSDDMLTAL